MTPDDFAHRCRQYRAWAHASVTSAGRTEKHNKAVGGVPMSAHLFDLAEDLVYDDAKSHTTAQRKAVAHRLGLLLLDEGDHHHVQPLDWAAG